MADDALKFRVDLVGNMVQELVSGGKAATSAEGNVQLLTAAIMEMTEASKKKDSSSFFTFDLAEGASMAIGFIETLAGKVYDLGKEIVHAAAGAQDLRVAVAQTVGPENAAGIDALANSFGDTRFDDDEIKKMVLPLLNAGLGRDNPALLKDIVTAATDTAARLADPAATGAVLEAFQRVHTKREVSAKMLLGVGINEQDFYTSLGETLGVSAKRAEAQVKAGKVQAETLEAELLAAIAKREGGQLGRATDESAKTLGTTLARLEHLPENLFKQLADSPGLALLQQRVDHFIDTLSGPAGERVVMALGGALDRVSQYLLGNGDAVDRFIDGVVTGIPKVTKFFESLATVVNGLAEILGAVVDLMDETSDKAKTNPALQGRDFTVQRTNPLARLLGSTPTQAPDGSVQLGAVDRLLGSSVQFASPDMPKANDFIWRNGQAIEIDPRDTVVGSKPGGSLDTPSLGAMRGGDFAPVYSPTYQISAGADEAMVRRLDSDSRADFARLIDEWRARQGAAA